MIRGSVVPGFGDPGAIAEQERPEPDEGQIFVRVRAASMNAADPIIVSGAYKDFMSAACR